MNRLSWLFLASAFVMAGLVVGCSKENANGEKGGADPGRSADHESGSEGSIHSVMMKLHGKGRGKGIIGEIKTDVKQDNPDWTAVQKLCKEYHEGAESIESKDPPKGDKESWKEQTTKYVALAKEMDDAAGKHDKDACSAAETKLETSCRGCHQAHKGRGR